MHELPPQTDLPAIHDNGWTWSARKDGEKIIIDGVLEDEGFEPIREHAEFEPVVFPEIEGPFYLKKRGSTDGSLPHGNACYLPEWDVILLMEDFFEFHGAHSKKSFTILAHEMGHREAAQRGLVRDASSDYAAEEARAWQLAEERYGSHPLFDRTLTDQSCD
ncbi:MAG: hypothetical protein Q7R83_03090 [bacterium]|nr:hypothetical protein [bacterium]